MRRPRKNLFPSENRDPAVVEAERILTECAEEQKRLLAALFGESVKLCLLEGAYSRAYADLMCFEPSLPILVSLVQELNLEQSMPSFEESAKVLRNDPPCGREFFAPGPVMFALETLVSRHQHHLQGRRLEMVVRYTEIERQLDEAIASLSQMPRSRENELLMGELRRLQEERRLSQDAFSTSTLFFPENKMQGPGFKFIHFTQELLRDLHPQLLGIVDMLEEQFRGVQGVAEQVVKHMGHQEHSVLLKGRLFYDLAQFFFRYIKNIKDSMDGAIFSRERQGCDSLLFRLDSVKEQLYFIKRFIESNQSFQDYYSDVLDRLGEEAKNLWEMKWQDFQERVEEEPYLKLVDQVKASIRELEALILLLTKANYQEVSIRPLRVLRRQFQVAMRLLDFNFKASSKWRDFSSCSFGLLEMQKAVTDLLGNEKELLSLRDEAVKLKIEIEFCPEVFAEYFAVAEHIKARALGVLKKEMGVLPDSINQKMLSLFTVDHLVLEFLKEGKIGKGCSEAIAYFESILPQVHAVISLIELLDEKQEDIADWHEREEVFTKILKYYQEFAILPQIKTNKSVRELYNFILQAQQGLGWVYQAYEGLRALMDEQGPGVALDAVNEVRGKLQDERISIKLPEAIQIIKNSQTFKEEHRFFFCEVYLPRLEDFRQENVDLINALAPERECENQPEQEACESSPKRKAPDIFSERSVPALAVVPENQMEESPTKAAKFQP